MTINIIAVGKIKEKYMVQAINDYFSRLGHYCKVEVNEVNEDINVFKEGENLKKKIPQGAFVVVLDLAGKEYSSEELAICIDKAQTSGYSKFAFIIGGSDGIADDIRKMADVCLCMSKMTFTHQMARLIILEQIYRAMKIIHNEPYHK